MINVVIPMAGKGQRFVQQGYSFPKPLIDVNNKPMIQVAVESLKIPNAKYIFLVLREHFEQYSLKYLLPLICKYNNSECEIVIVDKVTEGAACTVLLAKNLINNDIPLLIANSDQYVEFDNDGFWKYMKKKNADGGILTFSSTHPQWSFVKLDDRDMAVEVAEKKPISNIATVGIYHFSKGNDFVSAAEQMIQKDIRVNNEFYVCPVYNELIAEGKKIYTYPVKEMHGLGTPEDLEKFLRIGKI